MTSFHGEEDAARPAFSHNAWTESEVVPLNLMMMMMMMMLCWEIVLSMKQ
jgi:hypothetical protein